MGSPLPVRVRWTTGLALVGAVWPGVVILGVHALWGATWLQLGHRPRLYVDALSLGGIEQPFFLATMLLLLGSPLGLLITLFFLGASAVERHQAGLPWVRATAWLLALSCVTWVGVIYLWREDLFGAFEWFMD